jgi:hypothetical protein
MSDASSFTSLRHVFSMLEFICVARRIPADDWYVAASTLLMSTAFGTIRVRWSGDDLAIGSRGVDTSNVCNRVHYIRPYQCIRQKTALLLEANAFLALHSICLYLILLPSSCSTQLLHPLIQYACLPQVCLHTLHRLPRHQRICRTAQLLSACQAPYIYVHFLTSSPQIGAHGMHHLVSHLTISLGIPGQLDLIQVDSVSCLLRRTVPERLWHM